MRFCCLSTGAHTIVHTEYGMPSSHSQLIWFFVVYFFLFLYLRWVVVVVYDRNILLWNLLKLQQEVHKENNDACVHPVCIVPTTNRYFTSSFLHQFVYLWACKFNLNLKFCHTIFSFIPQNASNEQCSMCGPSVETHTVHCPLGHCLISLIQQVKPSPSPLHSSQLMPKKGGIRILVYGFIIEGQRYRIPDMGVRNLKYAL